MELRVVCFVFHLISVLRISIGTGVADIRFLSYNNPKYEDRDGHCCDSYWFTCSARQCDPYFIICLDDLSISKVGKCAQVFGRSKVYRNTDRVTFSSSIGSLDNPIKLRFVKWMGFHLKVDIVDEDSDAHDDIAIINFSPTVMPDVNGSHVFKYPVSLKDGPATISIEYSVSCDDNYYGSDCTLFCKPDWRHYSCSNTGQRLCFRGWTLPTCLIPTNACININCQNNASCITVNNTPVCICQPDNTGRFCESFVPSTTRLNEILQRTVIVSMTTKSDNSQYYEYSDDQDTESSTISTENDISYSEMIFITKTPLVSSLDMLMTSYQFTNGVTSTSMIDHYSYIVTDHVYDSSISTDVPIMETGSISTIISTFNKFIPTLQSVLTLPLTSDIYTLYSPDVAVSTIPRIILSTSTNVAYIGDSRYPQSSVLSTIDSSEKYSAIQNSLSSTTMFPHGTSIMMSTTHTKSIPTISFHEKNPTIQTKLPSVVSVINTSEIGYSMKPPYQSTEIYNTNSIDTGFIFTSSLEATTMSSMNFLETSFQSTSMSEMNYQELTSSIIPTVNTTSNLVETIESTIQPTVVSTMDSLETNSITSTVIQSSNIPHFPTIILSTTPILDFTVTSTKSGTDSSKKQILQTNVISMPYYTTKDKPKFHFTLSFETNQHVNTKTIQSTMISTSTAEIFSSIKPTSDLKNQHVNTVISTSTTAEIFFTIMPTSGLTSTATMISPKHSTVLDKDICNITVNITNNNTLNIQLVSDKHSIDEAIRRLIKDEFTDIGNATFGSHGRHIKLLNNQSKYIDDIRWTIQRKICKLLSVSENQKIEAGGNSTGTVIGVTFTVLYALTLLMVGSYMFRKFYREGLRIHALNTEQHFTDKPAMIA